MIQLNIIMKLKKKIKKSKKIIKNNIKFVEGIIFENILFSLYFLFLSVKVKHISENIIIELKEKIAEQLGVIIKRV